MRIGVGDVFAVRTGGVGARLIRLGAWLEGLPSEDNHVVVAHHVQDGVWWGVEGRPGGVGWVDMQPYLDSPATIGNQGQIKTPAQRDTIAQSMVAAVGTPYDWTAIAADAARDLDLPVLFAQSWKGRGVPGHLVCSSLAAWGYQTAGVEGPHLPPRLVQPGDWAAFNARWT